MACELAGAFIDHQLLAFVATFAVTYYAFFRVLNLEARSVAAVFGGGLAVLIVLWAVVIVVAIVTAPIRVPVSQTQLFGVVYVLVIISMIFFQRAAGRAT